MTGERRVDDGEELNADAKELDGRRRDAAAWLAAAPSPAAPSRARLAGPCLQGGAWPVAARKYSWPREI